MNDDVCGIIAEDLVDSALSANTPGAQFPLPAYEFFAYVSVGDLIRVADRLRHVEIGSNFFLGFTLLFYLNREISPPWKAAAFRRIISTLLDLREGFSQHSGVVLRRFPSYISQGSDGERIGVDEYRKLIFLLDNLAEIRVPYYRGWAFDVFVHNGKVYRVYNLGTIDRPEFVVLSGIAEHPPTADVFGHILTPEVVRDPVLFYSAGLEGLLDCVVGAISSISIGGSILNKVQYVLDAWSSYLGIERMFALESPRYDTSVSFDSSKRRVYVKSVYSYACELLLK